MQLLELKNTRFMKLHFDLIIREDLFEAPVKAKIILHVMNALQIHTRKDLPSDPEKFTSLRLSFSCFATINPTSLIE